jgi:hypothetical protein
MNTKNGNFNELLVMKMFKMRVNEYPLEATKFIYIQHATINVNPLS